MTGDKEHTEPTWHEFRNDRTQDTILRANDGVLLSASSHRLKLAR